MPRHGAMGCPWHPCELSSREARSTWVAVRPKASRHPVSFSQGGEGASCLIKNLNFRGAKQPTNCEAEHPLTRWRFANAVNGYIGAAVWRPLRPMQSGPRRGPTKSPPHTATQSAHSILQSQVRRPPGGRGRRWPETSLARSPSSTAELLPACSSRAGASSTHVQTPPLEPLETQCRGCLAAPGHGVGTSARVGGALAAAAVRARCRCAAQHA